MVEFGELEVLLDEPQLGTKPGKYLALLSHSGSRGVGFAIANHNSKIARERHPDLAQRGSDMSHLGWLDMHTQAGQEYWLAMKLAGKFASAKYRVIHKNVKNAAGFDVLGVVENHHNFAWIEKLADGRNV